MLSKKMFWTLKLQSPKLLTSRILGPEMVDHATTTAIILRTVDQEQKRLKEKKLLSKKLLRRIAILTLRNQLKLNQKLRMPEEQATGGQTVGPRRHRPAGSGRDQCLRLLMESRRRVQERADGGPGTPCLSCSNSNLLVLLKLYICF